MKTIIFSFLILSISVTCFSQNYYKNDKYKFSFRYPDGWVEYKVLDTTITAFYDSIATFQSKVDEFDYNMEDNIYSEGFLEENIHLLLEYLKKVFAEAHIIDYGETFIFSKPALYTVYEGKAKSLDLEVTIKYYNIQVAIKNILYTFTCSSPKSLYGSYQKVFNSILTSIVFYPDISSSYSIDGIDITDYSNDYGWEYHSTSDGVEYYWKEIYDGYFDDVILGLNTAIAFTKYEPTENDFSDIYNLFLKQFGKEDLNDDYINEGLKVPEFDDDFSLLFKYIERQEAWVERIWILKENGGKALMGSLKWENNIDENVIRAVFAWAKK